jgi:hypothetical protein
LIYPCDCVDMKWMMDNNNVFRKESHNWILAWTELDSTDKGTNIEKFGVKFNYCLFCGKRIG